MKINSALLLSTSVLPATRDEVKNEPMLFSCNLQYALNLGGPLTFNFVTMLPKLWKDDPSLIIDSRVHMLMPGWFPCIPGYHHDDVPRSRADGQPNYVSPEYKSEHCMLMMGDSVCRTEFALGECEMPDVPLNEIIYKKWHPKVEELLDARLLSRYAAPMDRLIYFNWQTFHQGIASRGSGWRFFIRASRATTRTHSNEIRRQVQVYLENPMEGW